jgi:hypothetical protein
VGAVAKATPSMIAALAAGEPQRMGAVTDFNFDISDLPQLRPIAVVRCFLCERRLCLYGLPVSTAIVPASLQK